MTHKSWLAILLTFGLMASLVILGACGGGDDDDGADPTDTPVEDVIDNDADDDDDTADDNDDAADDGDDGSSDGSVADLGGEWVGVWNNDTFSTSPPITLSISIGEDGSASMILRLSSTADSAPFGVPDVEPTMLEGTIEDGVLTVELVGHALFGDMTATILADGTLEVTATMDGAPGIAGMTVSGTFSSDGLDVTYAITFPDGSEATGTATLSRVGAWTEDKRTAGTETVSGANPRLRLTPAWRIDKMRQLMSKSSGSNGIIDHARSEGRSVLSEVEAKALLASAGIPVVEAKLATTADEAASIAADIGYPVALKIVSEQITHKSDVGGVVLNVEDADAVRAAFSEITKAGKKADAKAQIDGVSVQRMAEPGVEVITGMTMDPQFGPVLMFGLGGVLVEVLKDVAFRVVPITRRDASQMIREVQGFPILEGHRGAEPSDIPALEGLLVQLSEFIEAHPDIAELDLNPVFAYPKGAVAVDARIVLSEPS